jgi:hypothetical protein
MLGRAGEGEFVAAGDGINDYMDTDNNQGTNNLYLLLVITLIYFPFLKTQISLLPTLQLL